MCDSIAHGGYRCAAHTRPRLLEETPSTQEWDEAAADHAATPTGRRELEARLDVALAAADLDTEAALRTALRVGEARRDAYQMTRQTIAAHRVRLRTTGIKNDDYWASEMLDRIYSADKIVDRGEDVFFEEDNPVEIAAGRQHIIDLNTAAEKIGDAFKETHAGIPWKAIARTRDRNAHHYDNLNRDLVWNVLVVEFPKIRKVLREHLGL